MSARAATAGAAALFAATTLVVAASAITAPAPHATTRYAEGAPPGFSGGFGEQSCHACHFHAEINAGPGRITIDGVPERFAAGERYPLTITLTRPGITLGGFQLTARFQDGGAQAGTLAPAPGEEERVGVDLQGDVQYVSQRKSGTALASPDTARWSVVWTAPQAGGTVVFHAAANASNGDETAEGDYVHTGVIESAPSKTSNAGSRR